MEIPIVNFGGFLNGSAEERVRVSKEIIEAVKTFGFVYLLDSGIPKDLVESLFKLSRQFFSKPIEYKMQVKKSEAFVGYDLLGGEKLNQNRPGDLKECFKINSESTPWPSDWSEFREFMEGFRTRCYSLTLTILKSFAIGMNIDEKVFDGKFCNGDGAFLKLLHYPPLPYRVEENQIRAGEHTDYGALTVLFQDSVGGLEVKTLAGEWIPAPYYENTVLINVGDVLEMWTNGLLRSTPHRVINPSDERKLKSRYSVALFSDPDLDCEVKPLDVFVSEEIPSKYEPKLYRDHLFGKYKKTYV